MKVLLDSCVWGGAKAVIDAGGHSVEWVGDWPVDPGDEEILAYAASSHGVLITIDKDFGELAVVRGLPHAGIIRIVGFAAREQGSVALATLVRYADELHAGGLVTVERTRTRVRPGERSPD